MEILNQVRDANLRIDAKRKRIEQLQSLRLSITAALKKVNVMSSGEGDKLGELTAQIVDLENELIEEIIKENDKYKALDKILQKVCVGDEYTLMWNIYIGGNSISDAASEMGYSRQWAYAHHAEIIERLENDLTNLDTQVQQTVI